MRSGIGFREDDLDAHPEPTNKQIRRGCAGCWSRAGRRRDLDRDIERLRQVFTDTYLHQPPVIENAMGIQLTAFAAPVRRRLCGPPTSWPRRRSPILTNTRTPRSSPASPALGKLAGARVLAEIGDDRARFADARGLKAFAGSAPTTRASGKKTVVLQR